MANKGVYKVDDEIIRILKEGTTKNNVYYLPNKQLERNVYEKVDKVLKRLGGKWNRKLQGHIFEYDIADELAKMCEEKKVTDWKKATEFFYTPLNVINEMMGFLPVYYSEELNFLEPSCGQGHIVDEISRLFKNSKITCVEKNKRHCEFMEAKGYNPICTDFLDMKAEPKYDVILMNPPFRDEWEHIKHAYNFLKEGGYLVSVASNNVLGKESKKGHEFKEWFKEKDGFCRKLPPESFAESGTNIDTVVLFLEKYENKL